MWSKASRVLPSVKVLLHRLQDTLSDSENSYLSFELYVRSRWKKL